MLADLEAGRQPRQKASFDRVLDDVLEVIDLDFTILDDYAAAVADEAW